MGDKTEIEWADATWNPIRGCTRVSEGCRHCYAESIAARFSGPGQPFEGLAQRVTRKDDTRGQWTGKIGFAANVLLDPIKWQLPRTIFANSMSDLFHEAVMVEWIDQIMAVTALAPRHVVIVLTKRPHVMLRYMTDPAMPERVYQQLMLPDPGSPLDLAAKGDRPRVTGEQVIAAAQAVRNGPLPNLWLGVSVEDQDTADDRIPVLLQIPGAKRLISYEPALGPVDLTQVDNTGHGFSFTDALAGTKRNYHPNSRGVMRPLGARLDWVICGGESGIGARPMHPNWARAVRDQCVAAGVPFFFKQWGAWANAGIANDNATHHTWPDGAVMRLNGKRKSGHLLDGRAWQQTPPMPRMPARRARDVA